MEKSEIIGNNNTTYNNQLLWCMGEVPGKLISEKKKVPKKRNA